MPIMEPEHLEILRDVLSLPTAPFSEGAVVEYVRRFAAAHGLVFRQDVAGNVLLRCRRGRSPAGVRWVFTAHMDHPGFVVKRRQGRTLWAEFRGGVGQEYFSGAKAVFFTPGGRVRAVVERTKRRPGTIWRSWMDVRLRLERPLPVPRGTVGMWDFRDTVIRNGRISARGCDDLAGVAALLCAASCLKKRDMEADVTVLLTRAEEVGLVGAVAACRGRTIPPSANVVSIEASAAQPAAPLGGGVVVRVGDSRRTFDPALTAVVVAAAIELKRNEKGFTFQRRLMPGGMCESSAFYCWDYRAAALCLPLANYHNRGRGHRLAPEAIHLDDFTNLVRLLVGLAGTSPEVADTDTQLKARLVEHFEHQRSYLGDA